MVAEIARLLVSPADTAEQEQQQHMDGSGMFSVHLGVGDSPETAGTCFELGSYLEPMVRAGKRKPIALPPGGLVIALSNVRHAGSAVSKAAQARLFLREPRYTGRSTLQASKAAACGGLPG